MAGMVLKNTKVEDFVRDKFPNITGFHLLSINFWKEWNAGFVCFCSKRHWGSWLFEITFCKSPPLLRKNLVSRKDFCELMGRNAKGMELMFQPEKMVISSFKLQNMKLMNPPLLRYLELGLFWRNISLLRWRHTKGVFQQLWTISCRRSYENPKSNVSAETVMLLPDCSYGHGESHGSRHTVTKNLKDEKTPCAVNSWFSYNYIRWTTSVQMKLAKAVI